ncbi:MAG TPA: hypothetical protein VMY35_14970 [Phycisphaerae bacterium]|nr:hypothetical protein [Phycisphaerae bacterium]
MKQQTGDFPEGVRGAAADGLVDAELLAKEAWGEACAVDGSGYMALAYLWRRFGPPFCGCDELKDLACYVLTTENPGVFLVLRLGAWLNLSAAYLASIPIHDEANRASNEWCRRYHDWWLDRHPELQALPDTPRGRQQRHDAYITDRLDKEVFRDAVAELGEEPESDPQRWREDDGVVRRVNQALFDAMRELSRVVYVRDCPLSILGPCDHPDGMTEAEVSRYAGFRVPKPAMDAEIARDC